MDVATMFLNHVTVLDHAYIDDRGMIRGGSFHPSFLVEGDVDPVEKVVVDFSTVKKMIKTHIDDNQFGFDHKLWIMEGYSDCISHISANRIHINTGRLELDLPRNAVKIFECPSHSLHNVGRVLSSYVQEMMRVTHPGIRITCHNSVTPHTINDADVSMFTYVHGLKDSTSWGCQNNSHGHLSFVQVIGDPLGSNSVELKATEQMIADWLDGAILIKNENVIQDTHGSITIDYTTKERGRFLATYYRTPSAKFIQLDTETTIEYIIEYVATTFAEELSQCGATAIMISEGLSKGAYKKL